MTFVAEKFAQAVSWNLRTPLHFPTRESIDEIFYMPDQGKQWDPKDTLLGISGTKEGIPHLPDGLYQRPLKLNEGEVMLKRAIANVIDERGPPSALNPMATLPVRTHPSCERRPSNVS